MTPPARFRQPEKVITFEWFCHCHSVTEIAGPGTLPNCVVVSGSALDSDFADCYD